MRAKRIEMKDCVAMVFSPDGNRVVIGGDYGELLILNWQTGTVLPIQTQTRDGITALAFSPTDELIAAGFGYTSETIRLWDARSGEARGQPAGGRDDDRAGGDGFQLVQGDVGDGESGLAQAVAQSGRE